MGEHYKEKLVKWADIKMNFSINNCILQYSIKVIKKKIYKLFYLQYTSCIFYINDINLKRRVENDLP